VWEGSNGCIFWNMIIMKRGRVSDSLLYFAVNWFRPGIWLLGLGNTSIRRA
jgi:hypothetical protein